MQYMKLILSMLGLSVLCASAPTDNGRSITASDDALTNATVADASVDAAEPKEDDADDEFVYQWRRLD
ncbi:hypothetical protein F5Y06DRAFT_299171 [Hypoxylon sp. FL0890]|nr:hypothetical protein F5Y06DRAFT_299171 [Hypoxylon sp. FL0890]